MKTLKEIQDEIADDHLYYLRNVSIGYELLPRKFTLPEIGKLYVYFQLAFIEYRSYSPVWLEIHSCHLSIPSPVFADIGMNSR